MTEQSKEEIINPGPSTQQPTHDIEISKAFLRRLHSPVDPEFELLYARFWKALRQLHPDAPTAEL
jgi:hypothetical protein